MLHIKYRPQSFSDMIGNKETVEGVKSLISSKERPHTYLLHGPSGCGKTSLSRIMSREFGCHQNEIVEINISNNRGIDTARDIIDKTKLRPLYGPCRVYILDEVHKSTNEFQNALLKVLEEPPEHIYFILCTTEPDKLIKTVRNRCSTFSISPLSDKSIVRALEEVCKKESLTVDSELLKTIAKESLGSMRSALVMLDQIKDLKGDISEIIASVGIVTEENKTVIELCRRLATPKVKWKSIAIVLKNLEEDPEKVRRAVLGYFSNILLNEDNPYVASVIECFEEPFYNSGKAGLIKACYMAIKF
ncbi:MAG: DNA polymerase III subunit tau [Spirochaetes bacterium ADurb.Bin218]|nr:MAG: DNA polymerase III subunit tau [Spirochaetes bacterium ADurb.Bin218]